MQRGFRQILVYLNFTHKSESAFEGEFRLPFTHTYGFAPPDNFFGYSILAQIQRTFHIFMLQIPKMYKCTHTSKKIGIRFLHSVQLI
jgi:hypothetical protein